jgi:hypothetical protein
MKMVTKYINNKLQSYYETPFYPELTLPTMEKNSISNVASMLACSQFKGVWISSEENFNVYN